MYRPNCRNCPPVNFQLTSPTPASCHLVSSGHTLPPSLWLKGAKHAPFQSYQPLSMMLENSHMLSTDHRTLRRWSRSSHQTVAKWLPGRHPMATWSSPNFISFLTQLQASKNVWTRFWSWCMVGILKMKFYQDLCELVIWPKQVTLVSWTQPSGPLCLWQCFTMGYAEIGDRYYRYWYWLKIPTQLLIF